MIEHVTEWLGAYLDGELHGLRLLQVEGHLERCAACRAELQSLRGLSTLLRETPPTADFTPAERFASNLLLRLNAEGSASDLPRRIAAAPARKPIPLGWWLAPVALLGAWFFVRTVFLLTGFVSAAEATGLMGTTAGWLGGGQDALWFQTAADLFGGGAAGTKAILSTLNDLSVFGGNLFDGLLWQAGIVLLYWGWLALLWLRRRPNLLPGIAAHPAQIVNRKSQLANRKECLP
jgi:hypothetical protein